MTLHVRCSPAAVEELGHGDVRCSPAPVEELGHGDVRCSPAAVEELGHGDVRCSPASVEELGHGDDWSCRTADCSNSGRNLSSPGPPPDPLTGSAL
jgi:hypothetical protein